MPISYETIGESAQENRSILAGKSFLRVNSFFGEPRVLAASLVPIYNLNKAHTMPITSKILKNYLTDY